MARRLVAGILVICVVSLLAVAQEIPVLVQPGSAGLTSSQLVVLQESITRLQSVLNNGSLGCKKQLGVGGWTYEKFSLYTAGTLERLGYTTDVVSRQDATGSRSWVVVRIDVGGAVAWIPVEAAPAGDLFQAKLGDIPLISPLNYDSAYLSYEHVLETSANIPPVAAIRAPIVDVVETQSSAWFGNASSDPDGEIVLYQWTFDEEVMRATHTISEWYTFRTGGMEHSITLTVTDSRGAQATTSTTVYVLTLQEEEDKQCGCGG